MIQGEDDYKVYQTQGTSKLVNKSASNEIYSFKKRRS